MGNYKVLVIEDDRSIREGIVDALEFEGYNTFQTGHGDEGHEMALEVDCDLVLLDLVLPGILGLDILRAIRKSRPTLPVIIMTAKGSEDERVEGLKLGADDYVVKPFSIREFLARIQAVLRRSPARPTDITTVEINGVLVDISKREVIFPDGNKASISEREADLVRYLAQNAGRVISRQELLVHVWRIADPKGMETRTVDMHIARLREKIGDCDSSIIKTVRGKGYFFDLCPE